MLRHIFTRSAARVVYQSGLSVTHCPPQSCPRHCFSASFARGLSSKFSFEEEVPISEVDKLAAKLRKTPPRHTEEASHDEPEDSFLDRPPPELLNRLVREAGYEKYIEKTNPAKLEHEGSAATKIKTIDFSEFTRKKGKQSVRPAHGHKESIGQLKLAEAIRRSVGRWVASRHVPGITRDSGVTIVEVKVSRDRKRCVIWWLSRPAARKDVARALKRNTSRIFGAVAADLRPICRSLPRLEFREDHGQATMKLRRDDDPNDTPIPTIRDD